LASITLEHRAQVIVLGNEKGGSGKSTCAMHLIVGLLRDGYRVGAIDLDARQATLTARAAFARQRGIDCHAMLPCIGARWTAGRQQRLRRQSGSSPR
jgi:cellulose biosynthesis protein BcsQ